MDGIIDLGRVLNEREARHHLEELIRDDGGVKRIICNHAMHTWY